MHDVSNAPSDGSDTKLTPEKHFELADRFQAISDALFSTMVKVQEAPFFSRDHQTKKYEIGKSAIGIGNQVEWIRQRGEALLETQRQETDRGKNRVRSTEVDINQPVCALIKLDNEEFEVNLVGTDELFLLETLADIEPNEPMARQDFLLRGFRELGTEGARGTLFSQSINTLMETLETAVGHPVLTAHGKTKGRYYILERPLELISVAKILPPLTPGETIPNTDDEDQTELSDTSDTQTAPLGVIDDETEIEDYVVPLDPVLGFVPGPGSSDHHPRMHRSLEPEPDEESVRLRSDRGLQLALCKKFGFDPDAPYGEKPVKPLTDTSEDVRKRVIAHHFGLNGFPMGSIEEVSRRSGKSGSITPATVRYHIREVLKQLLPSPGESTLYVQGADAYLEFLDSQFS